MENEEQVEAIPMLRRKNCSSLSNDDCSITITSNQEPVKFNTEGNKKSQKSDKASKASLFFRDGIRSVDFVLVWDHHNSRSKLHSSIEKRRIYEEKLIREGLDLEYEKPERNGLTFVKVHAPLEVLRRYSEILKLRMPMREELCQIQKDVKMNMLYHATHYLSQKIPALQDVHEKTHSLLGEMNSLAEKATATLKVDPKVFPSSKQRFTAIYSRDREYLFDMKSPYFFTQAIRSRIVQFILDRNRFSEDSHDEFAFGIERLVAEEAYVAAYPLHDGDLHFPGSLRYKLYHEWSAVSKCFHYQPLDHVKEYFGVKIALYFAWLGFYTHMLIPASIVGVICFIYSCATLYSNEPSEDICNQDLNITMCPLCDYFCTYWNLAETCLHARVTYLFDNPTTVFFAIFMSFWAATFLELWKRYSAEITHRWDLTGFDIQEEHPRPQYLARLANVKRKQVNIVTNTMEPHVPFWKVRLPATILSFSIVMLLVALAVAAVLGVVLYRMSLLAALSVCNESVQSGQCAFKSYAMLFTTATAASINLCCIMVFNYVYTWLAELLTEMELLRTQTEFDDSLTLKIYLLQFVNYYASIFYIAFFKGRFVGYPKQYNRLFSYRQEECSPGGCLMELCIQLAIIMIGKQAMNTILEMVFPLVYKWINTLKVKTGHQKDQNRFYHTQWMKDFKLVEWGPRSLFPEYLEMVLQYGFVTIFVAAFPLAPFFALLNNILEMRLDAKKLLTYYRRPVTQRVRDIGIWFRILDSVGKLSVITNGFIIAFTSEFIPRIVYAAAISPDKSLKGFLNYSLSYFDTRDLEPGSEPAASNGNVTICRYPDYREPPWSSNKYEKTSMYWHVLAARLAFVVVFENVVAVVMILVRWGIPNMPGDLRDKIRRETYITNEIIIKQEAMRARGEIMTMDDIVFPSDGEDDKTIFWKNMSGSEMDLAGLDTVKENRRFSRSRPVMV